MLDIVSSVEAGISNFSEEEMNEVCYTIDMAQSRNTKLSSM